MLCSNRDCLHFAYAQLALNGIHATGSARHSISRPAVGRAAGRTTAKAAGEAAATLVGVFPAQWAAWTAHEQAVHLRAHALGRRLLVSLCGEQGGLQVAGLRRLDE